MISTNDLRRGMVIELDGDIHLIVEQQHIKPGKGSAFVRVKLKNLRKHSMVEKTLNAGVKVKLAEIDEKKMQYMYGNGNSLYFMDLETYEQIPVNREDLDDNVRFLKENTVITAQIHDGKFIGIELPTAVELKVTETGPSVKGNTVTGSGKPAILETGSNIQVPFFINIGDIIKVDTRTGKYIERI